jgi:hypothetical protein
LSKVIGEGPSHVYAAAQRFVEQGLKTDGSLFTPNRAIWTEPVALDVFAKYVVHPERSEKNGVATQPFNSEEAPDEASS